MKPDKDHLNRELMEMLIERGSSGNRYIGLKLFFWQFTIKMAYFIKRSMDIFVSLAMIIFLLPLLASVAILIKLDSRGPVFFIQTRVGKNGRHFNFIKFRSMRIDAEKLKTQLQQQNESKDGVIFKMKRDPRITRIGRIIRKFSIDELPQLFNVLVGDMSLVGPRPPLPGEVANYTLEEYKRLHITPGLTCIWQVSGRSDIPFKQQVELDKEYIRNRGFWKDLLILLKTIPAVITGRGAY